MFAFMKRDFTASFSDHTRQHALEVFNAALSAVDARQATRRAVHVEGSTLTLLKARFDLTTKKIYVVAIGKAALSMATAVSELLQNRITAGVITGPLSRRHPAIWPSAEFPDPRGWKTFSGGHPLPNHQSLMAAWQTFQLLKQANEERGLVIFLISGGGSAMIEWPIREDISLEDLCEVNRILISCGATIAEINAVRRSFSAVKGGGLSAAAPDTDQITLIVSDTNPRDPATVASGPTLEPESDAPSALDVLQRYDLFAILPASVVEAIKTPRSVTSSAVRGLRGYQVLLDNNTALQAAANKALELGYEVKIASDIVEQPIVLGSRELISRFYELADTRSGRAICLISGGEFACPVRGNGVGGRNLETVLRCARLISSEARYHQRHVVVLSAGTDGIDGNSPAAGAIADENSIAQALELGLDPKDFLDRSDSFRFFQLLDSVIMTDVTGTNVRDVRILLGI
jgi:hydroxypyruvate reductase